MKILFCLFSAFFFWFFWPLLVTDGTAEEAAYLLEDEPKISWSMTGDDVYLTMTPVMPVEGTPLGQVFVDYNGDIPATRVILHSADPIPLGTKMCLTGIRYNDMTSSTIREAFKFAEPC